MQSSRSPKTQNHVFTCLMTSLIWLHFQTQWQIVRGLGISFLFPCCKTIGLIHVFLSSPCCICFCKELTSNRSTKSKLIFKVAITLKLTAILCHYDHFFSQIHPQRFFFSGSIWFIMPDNNKIIGLFLLFW